MESQDIFEADGTRRNGFDVVLGLGAYKILRNKAFNVYVIEKIRKDGKPYKHQPQAMWDRCEDSAEAAEAILTEYLVKGTLY